MTHRTISGKDLLEWIDLFSVDNQGYRVLNKNFYELLNQYFLTENSIKDIKPIKEKMKDLQENFEALENKKSEGIEQELKEISQQVKAYKKEMEQIKQTTLKEIKEAEQKKSNLLKEIKELQEQYVKKLDSEILKKVPAQVKPEDLDMIEIIRKFHNRLVNSKDKPEEERVIIYGDIRKMIPQLNLTPEVKFKVLRAIGDDNLLLQRLRFLIDALQSGIEIKTTLDSQVKESKEGKKSEQQKKGDDYYGD